jgi:hypothetical protein
MHIHIKSFFKDLKIFRLINVLKSFRVVSHGDVELEIDYVVISQVSIIRVHKRHAGDTRLF